jgi:hypothetical protein
MYIVLSITERQRAMLIIVLLLLQDHNIMTMNSCLLSFSRARKATKEAADGTMMVSLSFSLQPKKKEKRRRRQRHHHLLL